MGTLQFAVNNGQLVILDGASYRALSGQETMRLLNLLMDYRTEIIVRGVSDMPEAGRKKKERQDPMKPKMIQVDGQWIECMSYPHWRKSKKIEVKWPGCIVVAPFPRLCNTSYLCYTGLDKIHVGTEVAQWKHGFVHGGSK